MSYILKIVSTDNSIVSEGENRVDANRFGELTVVLSGHRRTILRAFVAGALSALLGQADGAEAGSAGCRSEGAACKKKADCCSNICKKKRGKAKGKCQLCPVRRDCLETGCPDGQTCSAVGNRTRCFCDSGTTCADTCCAVGQACVGCVRGPCPTGIGFCPPTALVCAPGPHYCGTSVEGTTGCLNDSVSACADCTTDAECATLLGQAALCVAGDCLKSCPARKFCVAVIPPA